MTMTGFGIHVFFYKHIKVQGLDSDMLKTTQNIA